MLRTSGSARGPVGQVRQMRPIEGYVAAWRHALAAALDLGRDLDPDRWAAPTGCPGWSVGDLYAHLIGGELWMRAGGAAPDQPLPVFVQAPVDERRTRPAAAVLAELAAVVAEREVQLAADPLDADRPAAAAWGAPVSYAEQLRMRAFDAWVHEQDIRWAIGAPPALTSPGAWVARDIFLDNLPRVVAKRGATPVGGSVRITVVGEPGWDVVVRVDPDGRARLHPAASRGPARAERAPASRERAPASTAHLTLSWPEYVRRGCGRDGAAADVWTSGDAHLADRVLAALSITP